MISCGNWFCVENQKKIIRKNWNTPEYKVAPYFQWSEQNIRCNLHLLFVFETKIYQIKIYK